MTEQAAPNTSKNWQGIVAIITAILCGTQLLGVIFGALGLRSAKRGEATNRGLSLFALIWSLFWLAATVVGGVWFAMALRGPVSDAAAINGAIGDFQRDNPGQIITNIGWDGENYYVADKAIEAKVEDPGILLFIDGSGGYCIKITDGAASSTLGNGTPCEGTVQEVLTP